MGQPKRKHTQKDSNWTFVAIVLVAIALFLGLSDDDLHRINPPEVPPMQSFDVKVEDRINQHLKNIDVKEKLEAAKAQQAIPTITDDQVRVDYFERPLPLTRKQEMHSVEITREHDAAEADRLQLTPEQLIERSLANEQYKNDYDRKLREKYIDAFLKNARDQGFDVELNEDLEVTAVKRRQPATRSDRIPNSIGGSPGASK